MRRTLYKNAIDKERRNLLKTMTKAGITPGLLRASSLVGGMMFARASEAAVANKSLLIFLAGGAIDNLWRPGGGMSLGPMSQAYESVKNQMNFLAGGTMDQSGHGVMFGRFNGGNGTWTSDSFDVNVGRTIGENRAVRYLNLGVQSGATQLSRQGNSTVPTIDSPRTAFTKLFGTGSGSSSSSGGGSTSSGGPSPQFAFVDAHKEALDALKGKLGQHERERLDNHVGAIEEFENRLGSRDGTGSSSGSDNGSSSGSAASCSSVSQPNGTDQDPATGDFDTLAKAQIDIAMLALKCDLTSSVSISFGDDEHQFNVPGYNDVFHQSHHNKNGDEAIPEYSITANYMAGLGARCISRCQEEGILDSTIITQVTDMGDARTHESPNVPMFVAGGGLSGGRVTSINGSTNVNVFQSISEKLGMTSHGNYRSWGSGINI